MKGCIAPGSTYVADLKARRRTRDRLGVDALGAVYEDEDVGEQDVWKSRDGDKGITIRCKELDTMRVLGGAQLMVGVVKRVVHEGKCATISDSALAVTTPTGAQHWQQHGQTEALQAQQHESVKTRLRA
jgi:hypothetical protein